MKIIIFPKSEPDVASSCLGLGAGFCVSGSEVRVCRQDLRLEVPHLEEAELSAEENVGHDRDVGLRRRLPAVDQRLAHLERVRLLFKKRGIFVRPFDVLVKM